MKLGSTTVAAALVLAACSGAEVESTLPAAPAVTMPSPSQTTTASAAPSEAPTPPGMVDGVLPNGTAYRVVGVDPEPVVGVHAVITMDLEDGGSQVVGITRFHAGGEAGRPNEWFGDQLRLFTDGWRVTVDAYPEFLAHEGARTLLRTGLAARTEFGLPVIELVAPLRFATSEEVPSYQEVQYETFSVLAGCERDLPPLACSSGNAAQVVAAATLVSPAPPPPPGPVSLALLRPGAGPIPAGNLPRGPLEPRGGHSVTWTGAEVVVWGGERSEDGPAFADGAAFDPETNGWRRIADAPLSPRADHAAAWTGRELLIVGGAGLRDVAAYDPFSDTWRTAAAAPVSVDLGTPYAWDGASLFVWSRTGEVAAYDYEADAWDLIPDPGLTRTRAALHATDGGLYALGATGCGVLSAARLEPDRSWTPLPEADFSTADHQNCALPQTTVQAGERLMAWSDSGEDGPTLIFDSGAGEWAPAPPIPQHGCEGWEAPIVIDRGRVLAFGVCDDATIFDARTGSWTRARLPGTGGARHSVWTGREVITWGDTCCYGTAGRPFTVAAWRYEPPPP